jgi:hypothetical protein
MYRNNADAALPNRACSGYRKERQQHMHQMVGPQQVIPKTVL